MVIFHELQGFGPRRAEPLIFHKNRVIEIHLATEKKPPLIEGEVQDNDTVKPNLL
jgi:hypothetical protein